VTVPAFLAWRSVAAATAIACSQRHGVAAILVFLVVGIVLMLGVKQRQ
jgi:MFS-type transporter involved in bile tolerance (Atg22 family)